MALQILRSRQNLHTEPLQILHSIQIQGGAIPRKRTLMIMKVVFNSGNPVDLSATASVDVSDTDGNVKIIVRYWTRKGVNVNSFIESQTDQKGF